MRSRRRPWCSSLLLALSLSSATAALAQEETTAVPTEEGTPPQPLDAEAEPPSPPPEQAPVEESAPEQPAPEVTLPEPVSRPTAAEVISIERLRASIVEYRTAGLRGVGFLVNDRRTVLTLSGLRDRFRRITAKLVSGEGPEVRVSQVELATGEETPFVLLHLGADLPGEPLQISDQEPELGDEVYLILARESRRDERDRGIPALLEPASAQVTSASRTSLTVGTSPAQLWHGSPLFDARGRVVGFFGESSYALRATDVLAPEQRRSGRALLSPIFGVRVGTSFLGQLEDPVVFDFEAGLALWDQLGILFRLGVDVGRPQLATIPASALYRAGLVEQDQRAIDLSLEVKYRLLLTRSSLALYLDFVVGMQYTMFIREPRGLALYATSPACDPFGAACDLTVGPSPGRDTDHGIGAVFGFDLRAGLFTIGYRAVAEALSSGLPDTHRITFGLTYR